VKIFVIYKLKTYHFLLDRKIINTRLEKNCVHVKLSRATPGWNMGTWSCSSTHFQARY